MLKILVDKLQHISKHKKQIKYIHVPRTNLIINVLNVLIELGYINGYQLYKKKIFIFPKYFKGSIILKNISLGSKPSYKKYIKYKEINRNIYYDIVVSTNIGILAGSNLYKHKIGGKVLLEIS